MFVLRAKTNKGNYQGIATSPQRHSEDVYLFKTDKRRFPLLSLLDDHSGTDFLPNDMPQLLAELERAKSEAELEASWQSLRDYLAERITTLESDLKRYSHTMWSIEAEKTLPALKRHLQAMEQGQLEGQNHSEAVAHVNELIALAHRCQENTDYLLSHEPIADV